MGDSPFRVIIVGAGPVGLYMAHALQKAAIDFVILEQHSTPLSSAGQVLFIWPQTVRLFDQVGLMGPLQEAALKLHKKKRTSGITGRVLTSSNFWDNMREKYVTPWKMTQTTDSPMTDETPKSRVPLFTCAAQRCRAYSLRTY